jgi:putative Ca2+/H+ antiporter (TMEM165/GDT1 family)
MDNSSGMPRRSGWTWKVWVGIAVGLAVVAGLVVLIANAGGGSGGIY